MLFNSLQLHVMLWNNHEMLVCSLSLFLKIKKTKKNNAACHVRENQEAQTPQSPRLYHGRKLTGCYNMLKSETPKLYKRLLTESLDLVK